MRGEVRRSERRARAIEVTGGRIEFYDTRAEPTGDQSRIGYRTGAYREVKAPEVTRVFDAAISRWGKVDIVINAAGQSVFKPVAALTDEDFERVFSVNARGAMYVLREAANRIADGGRIVQFSTGGTKMAMPGTGAYSASKAAGEMLALNLAKELGSRGITVNVVSPGTTDTHGLVMPKEQLAQIVGMTPLGRLGQPADVGDVVAFLVSDQARWVTGQNIQVNGGIL